jgi:hypothetical protein
MRFVLGSLLVVGCHGGTAIPVDGALSSDGMVDAAPNQQGALPLGTVTAKPVACSAQAQPGASCQTLAIDCGGATVDNAEIAVSLPAGTPVATMTLHNGGNGEGYWGTGDLVPELGAANFRVVQLKWQNDWQVPGVGALHSGCLPATAYKWIHDNVHTAGGFCGGGISGGGASLGYSLSAYGLGSIFDYAMIVSGPAVSEMDAGCDVADYTGPEPAFCPEIPSPVTALPTVINSIESTSTCSCTTPNCVLASDKATWHADSIVSDGRAYAYPQTTMSFWFCGNGTRNGSLGGGAFYYDAVHAVPGNDVSIHCYTGASSACTGEAVFSDKNAEADAVSAVVAGCVAHH